jgi:ABC-type antimicrobial peptide transport system permease subunit
MTDVLDPATRAWELGAAMFTLFGALALLLAAVGLFSVISYNVSQRSHELGVRMALGASARNVLSLVVREGMRIATIGTAVGVIVALLAGRYLAPLLYSVSSRDPATFVVVVATLLAVALLASVIPARRAMKVDPTQALRGD